MPDTSELCVILCPQCNTEIAPPLLVCPACHRLVHTDKLKRIAVEAEEAISREDVSAALTAWRSALELLPPGTRQYEIISAKIEELGKRLDSLGVREKPHTAASGVKKTAGIAALGLLLWKLKTILLFVFTKAKLLLFGLTKGSTALSMMLSFGVYWTAWGWKFALGLVVSIYVHEMGHVFALQRYGIKATAPMFIPGFGAIVRLKQYPANPREDARVGLAGPLWGLAAAVVAYVVSLVIQWPAWAAIAATGAWINLFNLMPVWQLDGGRGFRSLSRGQRWIVAAAMAILWFLTKEGLLILLLIFAVMAACSKPSPEPDHTGLLQFLFLLAALSFLCTIQVLK